MQWLNSRNAAHIEGTVRCLQIRDEVRAEAQGARCSRPGTSYNRIKYAHQWAASKAGANEVAGGGTILDGAEEGFAVEATESAGGRGVDTGAGARKG